VKSRLLASVAVCAAVVLGATGCAMISPQGTTIAYSPSDGINVADAPGAPLQVRNALVVANDAGTVGNLVAGIVNTTDASQTLSVQVGTGSTAITKTVQVPAHSVVSLGQSEQPLRLDGIDAKPGSILPVYFQSGTVEGALANLPVMGNGEAYLQTLVPTDTVTP
jgi:hypothetical protein